MITHHFTRLAKKSIGKIVLKIRIVLYLDFGNCDVVCMTLRDDDVRRLG